MIEYVLLLLGGAMAYKSLKTVSQEGLNAEVFMAHIHKMLREKNTPRAIKLCSVTDSPIALAVKAVLLQSHRLQGESAERLHDFCEESFREWAERHQAKNALSLLDAGLLSSMVGLYLLFCGLPASTWVSAALGLSLSALGYEQYAQAGVRAALKQHAKPLAESILATYQTTETPYR